DGQRPPAALHLRGPESHRGPHLLLQRPDQDEVPLPEVVDNEGSLSDHAGDRRVLADPLGAVIARRWDHAPIKVLITGTLRLRWQHARHRNWPTRCRSSNSSVSTISAVRAVKETARPSKATTPPSIPGTSEAGVNLDALPTVDWI